VHRANYETCRKEQPSMIHFFLCIWQRLTAAKIISIPFFAKSVKTNLASHVAPDHTPSVRLTYKWPPSSSMTILPFSMRIILSITHTALMTWVVRLNPLDGILTAKQRVICPRPSRLPLMSRTLRDNTTASRCSEQRDRHSSANKCVAHRTPLIAQTGDRCLQAALSLVWHTKNCCASWWPSRRKFQLFPESHVSAVRCSGGWRCLNSGSCDRLHLRRHMSEDEQSGRKLRMSVIRFPVHIAVSLSIQVSFDVTLCWVGCFRRFDTSRWRYAFFRNVWIKTSSDTETYSRRSDTTMSYFLVTCAKMWKATIIFLCLSVRPHATTNVLPLDGFSWDLIIQYFLNNCLENSSLINLYPTNVENWANS
jgi:hypothetical protein